MLGNSLHLCMYINRTGDVAPAEPSHVQAMMVMALSPRQLAAA